MATRVSVRCARRALLVATMAVLLITAAAWGEEPTVSLKAVAINGVPIAPTNQIDAYPGDIITCEIYGSNWSPNGEKLRAWQVTIDGQHFGTDEAPVMPLYWGDVLCWPYFPCVSDDDCPAGYWCDMSGCCRGPDHHPWDGAFIDSTRSDYVFGPNPPEFTGVDSMSTLSFRYAAVLLQLSLAPVYTPPPKYFAALTLKVMPCACGTFTVGLLEGIEHTFFQDSYGDVTASTTVDLEINPGICSPLVLVASDPPNCAIDARQPSKPDGSNPAGWDSITLVPKCPGHVDLCSLGPEDFSVREVPSGGPAPVIREVKCEADSVTVTFERRIDARKWTCVKLLATKEEFCIGYLPGDVNGDGTAAPADILRVIDCLNGVASCEIWQCDVDRSRVCGPPDILRVIDILNGAGVYPPCEWDRRALPPCP